MLEEEQEELQKEGNKAMTYDFTKKELEFIIENANFTDIQLKVFNRLTDRKGRQSIVQISMEENISTSTVSRIVKQIKNKILRLL